MTEIPKFTVLKGNTNEEIVFHSVDKDGKGTDLRWEEWLEEGKMADVVPIIKCDGLWVIGNDSSSKIYCTWKLEAVRVFKPERTTVTATSFRPIDDDDEERLEDPGVHGEVAELEKELANGAKIEDDDDEDPDDEGVDPEEEESEDEA